MASVRRISTAIAHAIIPTAAITHHGHHQGSGNARVRRGHADQSRLYGAGGRIRFPTNSLALLSDALHNLGDVLGLGLAWGAAALARRPPTESHTYGWRRATLLSPLANALLLMAFSGALALGGGAPFQCAACRFRPCR